MAEDAGRGIVPYGTGEELPHINTQLFGVLDERNRGVLLPDRYFNIPGHPDRPTMDGFVTDYISMLMGELGRSPRYDEYAKIMTGYTPGQMPVLSALARGFAAFDQWFCDVPTCTFPNRSFFHAATSAGYVVNTTPADAFPLHNTGETLFDRLEAAGLTWRVYCDPPSHYSLTGLIHAARLRDRFATNFFSTAQFFQDAGTGWLPVYSFIEPQIIGFNHNDMHPLYSGLLSAAAKQRGVTDPDAMHFDNPSSLIAGEELLARIYTAIRNSTSPSGSNYRNTTLLVTFDEHGGTYDHVPPSAAVPPHSAGAPGQYGFAFNRSDVRIPTLAISAWIPQRAVVTGTYRATSLLATMREHWNLGPPFTARDHSAPSFAGVMSLPGPCLQEDWPEVTPRPVPQMPDTLVPLDAPLGLIGRSLSGAVFALAAGLSATVPDLKPGEQITGSQAVALAHEVAGDLFPAMRTTT